MNPNSMGGLNGKGHQHSEFKVTTAYHNGGTATLTRRWKGVTSNKQFGVAQTTYSTSNY